jgi:molybdopterin-binding protein
MKISARNTLKGKVLKVTHGAVNSEITLELAPGIEITSIITRESATRLGLEEGKSAYAIIKASDVMVGVD